MTEEKFCNRCRQTFDISKFAKSGAVCKKCRQIYFKEYRNTFDGFMKSLYNAAKNSAKERFKKGRILAGEFTLKHDDIFEQWDLQNGLCYYSKIPMITKPFHNWQCTIERKNPNLGYIKTNIVLTCLEFNGSIQWSHDTINIIYTLLQQPYEYIPINYDIVQEYNKELTPKFKITHTIDNHKYIKCKKCGETKLETEFLKKISEGCKKCNYDIYEKNMNIPRKLFANLLSSSLSTTKDRLKKTNRKSTSEHDINIEFLIELYEKQKGLCAYSELSMKFGINSNYRISLERINPLIGYMKTNVCLICNIFNTGDFTANALNKNDVKGSSAWSKEKFELFMISLLIHM